MKSTRFRGVNGWLVAGGIGVAGMTGGSLAAQARKAETVAPPRSSAALIEAVQRHDRTLVRALLSGGADVNARQPDGVSALLVATEADDLDLTSMLLAKGADVNAANDFGVTALSAAALN